MWALTQRSRLRLHPLQRHPKGEWFGPCLEGMARGSYMHHSPGQSQNYQKRSFSFPIRVSPVQHPRLSVDAHGSAGSRGIKSCFRPWQIYGAFSLGRAIDNRVRFRLNEECKKTHRFEVFELHPTTLTISRLTTFLAFRKSEGICASALPQHSIGPFGNSHWRSHRPFRARPFPFFAVCCNTCKRRRKFA